ncbi:MAG: Regulatory protein RecX [Turneriella sp.]|nr:Regulatory protein RecX [Turneriella sp.]
MRSVSELRIKLIQEEYPVEEIEVALERLSEVYLLDDKKIAESIVRQYKDRSNRFIINRLKQKGIHSEIHLDAMEALECEEERALFCGKKKAKVLENIAPHIAAQKIYQHLAMRGFSSSLAQKVARILTKDSIL